MLQTGQDRQRSNSPAQNVLQTVAQKLIALLLSLSSYTVHHRKLQFSRVSWVRLGLESVLGLDLVSVVRSFRKPVVSWLHHYGSNTVEFTH